MVEVLRWGKRGPSEKALILATKIKVEKEALKAI
jgi:hypothetical protein